MTALRVTCDGYSSHSEIEFQFELSGGYGNIDSNQIQSACPLCKLNDRVSKLETDVMNMHSLEPRVREMADKLDMLQGMHDWWEANVAVEDGLLQGGDEGGVDSSPG